MTIADIDKRLAEIELWEPCQHTEEEDDRREDCADCVDLAYFLNWRKALLKALRAVLELCDQKCLCGKAGCGNRLFITAPEIHSAIDSAFEGENDA